jgi:hypothetical protein
MGYENINSDMRVSLTNVSEERNASTFRVE